MKIRLLYPARVELVEAINYYNQERSGLGSEFREEAWLAIQRIREFPNAWSPLGGRIRRCQLGDFRMESSMSQRQMKLSSLLLLICIVALNIGVLAKNISDKPMWRVTYHRH